MPGRCAKREHPAHFGRLQKAQTEAEQAAKGALPLINKKIRAGMRMLEIFAGKCCHKTIKQEGKEAVEHG